MKICMQDYTTYEILKIYGFYYFLLVVPPVFVYLIFIVIISLKTISSPQKCSNFLERGDHIKNGVQRVPAKF